MASWIIFTITVLHLIASLRVGYCVKNASTDASSPKSITGVNKNVEKMIKVYESIGDCWQSLGPERAFPNDGQLYCNGTWDTVLCWPAALAGSLAKLSCPKMRGLDPSKFAHKKCGVNGTWEGRFPGEKVQPWGWTNFSTCLTKLYTDTYDQFYKGKSAEDIQRMKDIVAGTRLMEMVGLGLSFISITFSIAIFSYFRNLKCNRTRIHLNLFIAIILQEAILLVVYTDQFINRFGIIKDQGLISNTFIVCELLYALIEYTKSVVFMWMFIEGVYLHNLIAISVFSSGKPNYYVYYFIGWGMPLIFTTAWALTNGFTHTERCWWGYPYLPTFWILEGPRATVVAVNLIFLLNIVRVLVTKLRESHSNEALQVRKAVKAAIVLLPLLGISNFITMVPEPTDDPVTFGCWSYISHFLTSFQGFFIALLYCFLNGEVQQTLKKQWERHRLRRPGYFSGERRLSRTFSVFTSVTDMPCQVNVRNQPTQSTNGHTRLPQSDHSSV